MLYFDWLISLVDGGPEDVSDFIRLLTELDSIPYFWLINLDDNRAFYGYQLREIFETLGGIHDERIADKPCSFLEFLIGMATRMEQTIMSNSEYGDRTPLWFWSMMDNSGLSIFDDSTPFNGETITHIRNIVNRILNRRFDANGDGGLFPLKNAIKDQRLVDFWTQAGLYLEENYHEV